MQLFFFSLHVLAGAGAETSACSSLPFYQPDVAPRVVLTTSSLSLFSRLITLSQLAFLTAIRIHRFTIDIYQWGVGGAAAVSVATTFQSSKPEEVAAWGGEEGEGGGSFLKCLASLQGVSVL